MIIFGCFEEKGMEEARVDMERLVKRPPLRGGKMEYGKDWLRDIRR